MDDAHKHVQLSRQSAKVSSAGQSGTRQRGGAFSSKAFSNAFDIGTEEFVVVQNDGAERRVADVLRNVVSMWERLLT
jgi:hypothetical protein